jgi:CRISPR-associated endoribonuclease Cas6
VPWVHKEKANSSYEGALYAALDCIQQGNPALAQQIHEDKSPPPFSAMLENGVLRVGVLRRDVFMALNGSKLAYKAEIAKASTMSDLWQEASEVAPTKVVVTLVSPVSFARANMMHVLPEPSLLFGSLHRRWHDMGGRTMPELSELNLGKVVVGSCELHSQRITTGKYIANGTTGKLTLALPLTTAVPLYALLCFGEYAGVGQRTTQGFGQMRVEAR